MLGGVNDKLRHDAGDKSTGQGYDAAAAFGCKFDANAAVNIEFFDTQRHVRVRVWPFNIDSIQRFTAMCQGWCNVPAADRPACVMLLRPGAGEGLSERRQRASDCLNSNTTPVRGFVNTWVCRCRPPFGPG